MASLPDIVIREDFEQVRPMWRRVSIGWMHRRIIFRTAAAALVLSTVIAFLIPKQYESTTRIMMPEGNMSTAMLAALSGRMMPGNLGMLAGSMLGLRSSSTMFVSMLQSRAVMERVVDRFDLQHQYRSRYKQDAIRKLKRRTEVTEDRKTGIITLTVEDTDRQRARDMAQAYLDELNQLVARVNTSAAGRERQFIEQRLISVKADLTDAERQMSSFASKNTTLDVKEQTRAMVDATARLEGELIVARSELSSLDQIYGPENVRVRAAKARMTQLDAELKRSVGNGTEVKSDALYPPLRAIPNLSVQWADLYRRVKVQETVYDLLTQEYEMARIEEAKSIPTLSVIDVPNWPEKKSFPPRLLLMLLGTFIGAMAAFFVVVSRTEWREVDEADPRKTFIQQIAMDLSAHFKNTFSRERKSRN